MKKKLKIFIATLGALIVILSLYSFQPDISVDELKLTYAKSPSQFLKLNGMDVHYRIEGEGQPLVLIHGTASSLHTWDDWTDILKDNFKVIRLDMPGFGLTGPHPERKYALTDYSDLLNQFLKNLEIDSLYLAGNSLGGSIAWQYSLDYPEQVKKLILIDAAGFPKEQIPKIFTLAQDPFWAPVLRWVTPKFLIADNLREVYHDDAKVNKALITRYHKMSLRAGNRDAFIDRAKLTFADQTDQLQMIRCPTLIQWGKYDNWIPLEDGEAFNRLIPKSQLIIYEAGHVPMEEIPEQTALDAYNFLMSNDK